MKLPLSILGVTGKMGKRVLALAASDPEILLVGGSARPNSIQRDLSELIGSPPLHAQLYDNAAQALADCRVAIDVSTPEATRQHVEAARVARKALVIGTTGLSSDDLELIQAASCEIPILLSPNFSLGVALSLNLITTLSHQLPDLAHIDIIETHHIHKKDKPSGTALAFAKAVGRTENIPIESIRNGDTVGEHLIRFTWGHEQIEIKHTAHSRDAFAHGALQAAKLLVHRPPGLYV